MSSRKYWEARANQRLIESEATAKQAIYQVGSLYNASLDRIRNAINDLYAKISKGTGLDVSELSMILEGTEKANYVASLIRKLQSLGVNVNTVISPNQIRQLTRLQALKQEIYWEILQLSKAEERVSELTYRQIIEGSYRGIRADLRTAGVVSGAFGGVDNKVMSRLISERWQGGNFKTRITKNANKFIGRLQTELGSALMTGQDLAKVQQVLRRDFGIATYDATRLIRTEAGHFHNQARLEGMKRDGIKQYRFVAKLDGRTSDVCRDLDGEVINIEDAVEGVNYPVLHPNCRSTTAPVVNRM